MSELPGFFIISQKNNRTRTPEGRDLTRLDIINLTVSFSVIFQEINT